MEAVIRFKSRSGLRKRFVELRLEGDVICPHLDKKDGSVTMLECDETHVYFNSGDILYIAIQRNV